MADIQAEKSAADAVPPVANNGDVSTNASKEVVLDASTDKNDDPKAAVSGVPPKNGNSSPSNRNNHQNGRQGGGGGFNNKRGGGGNNNSNKHRNSEGSGQNRDNKRSENGPQSALFSSTEPKSSSKPEKEKEFSTRFKLFVGNLSTDTTEQDVKKMFEPFISSPNVFFDKQKLFGFVRMVSFVKEFGDFSIQTSFKLYYTNLWLIGWFIWKVSYRCMIDWLIDWLIDLRTVIIPINWLILDILFLFS